MTNNHELECRVVVRVRGVIEEYFGGVGIETLCRESVLKTEFFLRHCERWPNPLEPDALLTDRG
jgi:hypothetical protein